MIASAMLGCWSELFAFIGIITLFVQDERPLSFECNYVLSESAEDECHLYVNPTFFRLISPRSVMQNKPTYYMAASQVSFLRK
jgi:hypothetical protein